MIDTDIIFLGRHYSGGRYRFGTKMADYFLQDFTILRAREHLINVGWAYYCKK
jgi:hypothetical protein